MKSKLIFIGLCASLFIVSCNRDNQVSIDQAKNYINEHAKYTSETAPLAKSGIIKWDFSYTDEAKAKVAFSSGVQQYLKKQISFQSSGEGEINETSISSLCKTYYLSKDIGATLEASDKVYINDTGVKIVTTYYEDTYNITYTTQWDGECKIISSDSNAIYENYNFYRQFTFTY